MAIAPTKIRGFEIAPLDIPLFEPFGISGGAQAAANNVLVTLELADGTRGFGEAEFRRIGQWIGEVADGLKRDRKDNSATEAKVREEVLALTARFPIYN